jgi:AraC-like DNA-binding protein
MNFYNISKRTIEYIEPRLCYNLHVDSIANSVNYSKYHFHRLFLAEMGISVTEYVRRRRLIRSAFCLIFSDKTISSIAYDFGFNNLDTYIRCFKKYYGITPSEYRTLRVKTTKICKKENNTMKNIEYSISNCSMEDKQNALIYLDKIIELSKTAHKNGLLALENAVKKEEAYLFKAIELLLDGTEPQELREMLSTYITTSKLEPLELLERVIYLEGILLIQEGAYPWDVRKKLSSYFGESFIDILNNHFQAKDNFLKNLQDYLCEPESTHSETKLLDNELKNIDKRSMQRLLRECDIITLTIAFKGASYPLKKLFIESLPKGRQNICSEILELISEPSMAHIIDSQNEIIKIAKALRVSKDIT